MLHNLLELTRPFIVLDSETTGVDVYASRVVQIGFEVWTDTGLELGWQTLVNPLIPIPPETTAIHGITDEMVQGCQLCGQKAADHDGCMAVGVGGVHTDEQETGRCIICGLPSHPFKPWPTFRQLAPRLGPRLSNCDLGGKNVRFDLKILANEFQRVGFEWSYASACIIDAERLEQIAIPRRLTHLYEKYEGKPLEGAHGALVDASASARVIARQLEGHPTHTVVLPRTLRELHDLQWEGWLDSVGAFRMVNGKPMCAFGKHSGSLMQDVPIDYYDYIIRNKFPPDVQELARKAKLGEFPT